LKDLVLQGRILLKRIFKKLDVGVDWNAVAQDRDKWWSCCECGNERSDSIKCEEFLDWLGEMLASQGELFSV
jgi:hypothetical protein